MNTDTNLNKESVLSIPVFQGVHTLVEDPQLAEQVFKSHLHLSRQKIRNIFIAQSQQNNPEFAEAFKLLTELHNMGLWKEVHVMLTEFGDLLLSKRPDQMKLFRLRALTFHTYYMPIRFKASKEPALFKGIDVVLEHWEEKGGVYEFMFYRKGDEDPDMTLGGVAVISLEEFAAAEKLNEEIADSSDVNGEHVQKIYEMSAKRLVELYPDRVIAAYIKAGREFPTFN